MRVGTSVKPVEPSCDNDDSGVIRFDSEHGGIDGNSEILAADQIRTYVLFSRLTTGDGRSSLRGHIISRVLEAVLLAIARLQPSATKCEFPEIQENPVRECGKSHSSA
jgi:hypothetical protein